MGRKAKADSGDGLTWVGLTVACADVGVSKSGVRNWVHAGKVEHRVVAGPYGPTWEVPLERVRAYAASRPRPGSAAPAPAVSASELVSLSELVGELRAALETVAVSAASLKDSADRLAEVSAATSRKGKRPRKGKAKKGSGKVRKGKGSKR